MQSILALRAFAGPAMGRNDERELTALRRAALVTFHLCHGDSLTVAQVADMCHISRSGARNILMSIAEVVGAYWDPDEHTWQMLAMREV